MIKKIITKELGSAIVKSGYKRLPYDKLATYIEIPKNRQFGDYAINSNHLFIVNGKTSLELANEIVKNFTANDIFTAEVVQSGFINFKLTKNHLYDQVKDILEQKEKFGHSDLGKDLKVNIEFISANPTGPLTVGNSRGGVIGDVLANILANSQAIITREYYFNDAGGQIDELGHSIVGDDQSVYQGEYVKELRKKIKTKDYRQAGITAAEILIKEIKETTQKMGIKFDVWFKEGENLRDKGKVQDIIDWMLEKNLAYKKDDAIWFRSTKFGDEKDRVIVRSNGEPTYFGVDCAYHKNKFLERKFNQCINIWGADHHGDVARVKGFVEAIGFKDKFAIILQQFVRVLKDGKEVRMSKRAGNFVLVDDVLKEVGKDAFRFFMLSYPANTHMNFDLNLAVERSQKNPVYYVQYAYARIHSILAKSQKSKVKSQNDNSKSKKLQATSYKLNSAYELDLIKSLIKLPDLVEEIAGDYQVHRLTQYAREIADKFHVFYENCQVIDNKNPEVTQVRLALCQATKIVLKNTLDLMGISTPEKM